MLKTSFWGIISLQKRADSPHRILYGESARSQKAEFLYFVDLQKGFCRQNSAFEQTPDEKGQPLPL